MAAAYSSHAKSPSVLLGYPDEDASAAVDYTTNVIGGMPTFPPTPKTAHPTPDDLRCSLCSAPSVLVSQIYAPLDDSPYHRTLYLFACLSPVCWNKTESWKCFRLQFLDSAAVTKSLPALTTETATARTGPVTKTTDWFGEADDWGEEADTFDVVKSPVTAMEEENGNFVLLDNGKNFNQNLNLARLTLDDDDEDHRSHAASAASPSPTSEASEPSSSCSSAATPDPTSNANAVAAASARVTGESATAEIEDDQDDVIACESPPPPDELSNATIPVLFATPTDNSCGGAGARRIDHFRPFYVSVDEERFSAAPSAASGGLTEHERQLLLDYKEREGEVVAAGAAKGGGGGADSDIYEKVLPKHGDALFHKFVSVIQENPGQVLRYTRDPRRTPLFLSKPSPKNRSSSSAVPDRCSYCRGPVQCELQILPSLLPFLRPPTREPEECSAAAHAPALLEFGTALVYTCSASCWREGDTFKAERMLVQAEAGSV